MAVGDKGCYVREGSGIVWQTINQNTLICDFFFLNDVKIADSIQTQNCKWKHACEANLNIECSENQVASVSVLVSTV